MALLDATTDLFLDTTSYLLLVPNHELILSEADGPENDNIITVMEFAADLKPSSRDDELSQERINACLRSLISMSRLLDEWNTFYSNGLNTSAFVMSCRNLFWQLLTHNTALRHSSVEGEYYVPEAPAWAEQFPFNEWNIRTGFSMAYDPKLYTLSQVNWLANHPQSTSPAAMTSPPKRSAITPTASPPPLKRSKIIASPPNEPRRSDFSAHTTPPHPSSPTPPPPSSSWPSSHPPSWLPPPPSALPQMPQIPVASTSNAGASSLEPPSVRAEQLWKLHTAAGKTPTGGKNLLKATKRMQSTPWTSLHNKAILSGPLINTLPTQVVDERTGIMSHRDIFDQNTIIFNPHPFGRDASAKIPEVQGGSQLAELPVVSAQAQDRVRSFATLGAPPLQRVPNVALPTMDPGVLENVQTIATDVRAAGVIPACVNCCTHRRGACVFQGQNAPCSNCAYWKETCSYLAHPDLANNIRQRDNATHEAGRFSGLYIHDRLQHIQADYIGLQAARFQAAALAQNILSYLRDLFITIRQGATQRGGAFLGMVFPSQQHLEDFENLFKPGGVYDEVAIVDRSPEQLLRMATALYERYADALAAFNSVAPAFPPPPPPAPSPPSA